VFCGVMGIAVGITTATFPLLPRQFTLASSVTIGIPAFLLALLPSAGPWRPEGFLRSVVRFAVPAGIAAGIGIVGGYLLARYGFDVGLSHARTVTAGIVVACGLVVVLMLEREGGRKQAFVYGLCAAMALLFVLALGVPFARDFFELEAPTGEMLVAWAAGSAAGVAGMLAAVRLARA
jgi:cation-transporting ATPase E